ncbi:MAG: hypothetical protein KGH61_05360 [Candidatus Micrarchaeota archaeon]|nr:hypothetical protein [Candidatus Micrarchaeota archaeon]MDE1848342.1 hypothetical protein [Candidatus Micrarchaeota archaeon]MDE1863913.1 hypothetical protein [Candidatus Micrarchaeota archaeon]
MKLQFLSFDVIFAVVTFAFAVSMLAFVWYTINSQLAISSGTGVQNMQVELQAVSDKLLGTGYPNNWYAAVTISNTITWSNMSIGLGGQTPGLLSLGKVMTFESMANGNYLATKPMLGVEYDYYVTIQGTNFIIPIGRKPSPFPSGGLNGVTVQSTTKAVTINGQSASMQIYIWTNSSFGVG